MNCSSRAFFISSSIIKLLIAFIEGFIAVAIFIKLVIGSRNAIFRKIASFSLIVIVNSLLASFMARVVEEGGVFKRYLAPIFILISWVIL
jgi:hypothetical protein